VTAGYYALDHFNAERIARKEYLQKNGYPHIFLARNLEHIFGAFAVIIHSITFGEILPPFYLEEVW
jgi:hypothetical protein